MLLGDSALPLEPKTTLCAKLVLLGNLASQRQQIAVPLANLASRGSSAKKQVQREYSWGETNSENLASSAQEALSAQRQVHQTVQTALLGVMAKKLVQSMKLVAKAVAIGLIQL